ncbi:MAG: xylulokinase [Nostoc sp. DedVER02]|uniref:xylulokinase n=1 Tax=unclassified Nostoc TaxID=2593658 RepID=UPI002AD38B43|nr:MULTISPECIES: xylulokinase [unclassified Nostoc]MDZ7985716.1 xylulokinase [Nostoc sp. DedVER02]MDZ8111373.1 xylulokinase [Nostoc sp. DedVER01b]
MLLGIDLGTGSAKALLMATDGTAIGEASSSYPVHAPQPGWAESESGDWWSAVALAVRKAVGNHADRVQAIALSGQMHGVVLTSESGEPLRPAILWADSRSSATLNAYHSLDAAILERLGNPITAGMAGSTLLWLREHEPTIYAQARWAFQPKDWLRFRLTGEVATEPSDASGTLLYDVVSDNWAWDVISALNLRCDWLPKIIPSSAIAGYLTASASEHLGLPIGLPVIAGAADTAAAALGNGLLEAGLVQLTIGTGAQIITPRSQPIIDPHGRTHLYRAAVPNQWYTLAAMQNAGLALEWVRGIFGLSWEQVYTKAFSVPPGCEGLTFLPYLTGERTPHLDPYVRGAWVGLGLHHTQAHMMRAALEGVAFALRQGFEALEATGFKATELRLAGGGTVEMRWKQLLADVLKIPLYATTVAAASARGAALLAGIGIGVYADTNDINKLAATPTLAATPQSVDSALEEAWIRYQSLYPRLRKI